jgi:hypothetical protein
MNPVRKAKQVDDLKYNKTQMTNNYIKALATVNLF